MNSVNETSSRRNLTIHDFLNSPIRASFSNPSCIRTQLFLETLERNCRESSIIKPLITRAAQELLATRSNESILKRTVKIICREAELHGIHYERELSLTNLSNLIEEIEFIKGLKWIEFYNCLQSSNSNLFGSLDLPSNFEQNQSLVRETGAILKGLSETQNDSFGQVFHLHLDLKINPMIPSAIETLTNLRQLTVSRIRPHRILDFTAISLASRLTILSVRNLNIETIEFVESLPTLEQLYIDVNAIVNLAPVAELKKLKVLQADNNKIDYIDPISSLTDLEVVSVNNNSVRTIPSLKHLGKLKRIYLKNNQITKAPQLPESLRAAWFSGNFITDPRPFLSCTKLKRLDLTLNCISDKKLLDRLTTCAVKLDHNPRFLTPETPFPKQS